MNNRNWVENTIFGIIGLNIFVLAYVFIIPRAQFIVNHWGAGPDTLMETIGAMDTPNQYFKSYKLVNQIRKVVGTGSKIFISADIGELRKNRSVVIQRLYPRKVYFLGEHEADKVFSDVLLSQNVYMVFKKQWGSCIEQSVRYLEDGEIGVCRTGK